MGGGIQPRRRFSGTWAEASIGGGASLVVYAVDQQHCVERHPAAGQYPRSGEIRTEATGYLAHAGGIAREQATGRAGGNNHDGGWVQTIWTGQS